jgi:hypothetical protein
MEGLSMKRGFFAILAVLTVFAMVFTSCGDGSGDEKKSDEKFTVSFDLNGGTGTTPAAITQQSKGEAITLPGKDGLTGPTDKPNFVGWGATSDADTALTSPYTPSKSIKLFAIWSATATPATITFNLNGGSGTAPTMTGKNVGDSITLPGGDGLTGPTEKPNFVGWGATNNADTALSSPYTITSATVTFYAIWSATATPATITFNLNGGSGTAPTMTGKNVGASITLPDGTGLTGPNDKPNFVGWGATNNATTALTSPYTITSATVTFYAIWSATAPTPATVTFDLNGGSGTAPATITDKNVGDSITLPGGDGLTGPAGKTKFVGWNTDQAATTALSSSYTIASATVTLYAIWEALPPVTVTFSMNGATSAQINPVQVPGGQAMGDSFPSAPTKTNFEFDGWWNTTGDNFVEYLADTPVTANVTVTARWIKPFNAAGEWDAAGTYDYQVPLTGAKVKNTTPFEAADNSGMWVPLTLPAGFDISKYDKFTATVRGYNVDGSRRETIGWVEMSIAFATGTVETGSIVTISGDGVATWINYGAQNTANVTLLGTSIENTNPTAFGFTTATGNDTLAGTYPVRYGALESLTFHLKPPAVAEESFFLNLALRTGEPDGGTNTGGAFGTPPTGSITDGVLTLSFNANNQGVCFKLTEEQIDKVMATGTQSVDIEINGSADPEGRQFRTSLCNPNSTANWNGTNTANNGVFASLSQNLLFHANKSRITCGYLVIQQREAGDTTVTINSIKITVK